MGQGWLLYLNTLCGASNSYNLNDLIEGIWKESDDQQPVEQIDWDTMSALHLSSSDLTDSSVGSKDDNWGKVGLKSSVKISEALDIKHVHLINEKDTWNKLGDTVIDVFVHNFVNFESQLFGDLGLLWSVDLAHEGQEIVATLWLGVGHIEIVEGHILDDLLLLMDISLWNWDIFLSLEVIFGSVGI